VKRIYVMPTACGAGVGARILAKLEDEARVLGVVRLLLETGARQPEAVPLYWCSGFVEIPRLGEYVDSPLSLCMAKTLSARPA
jgi:GNAT superfamily N-acetyltransferase